MGKQMILVAKFSPVEVLNERPYVILKQLWLIVDSGCLPELELIFLIVKKYKVKKLVFPFL